MHKESLLVFLSKMITTGSGKLNLGSSTSAFDREMIVRGKGTCTRKNRIDLVRSTTDTLNVLSYTFPAQTLAMEGGMPELILEDLASAKIYLLSLLPRP